MTIDPYANYSSSPETQANRGVSGGAEETVSNIATGVGGAFPIVGGFMGIGKAAYKGLKSTDTRAGDVAADFFAPHHQFLSEFDMASQTSGKEKGEHIAAGILGMLLPGIATPALAGIRGDEKRAREARIDRMVQWARGLSLNAGVDMPVVERPTPGKEAYMNDLNSAIGGIGAMASAWGNKGGGNSTGGDYTTAPVSDASYWTSQGMPYENAPTYEGTTIDTASTGYQGSNYTWNLKKGGVVSLHGGNGNDDLAVIDTNTGEDTGVRMEKGEMVVFSKDTLNSLRSAMKNKDKKEVFKIVTDQMKKSGEAGHYKKGGQGEIKGVPVQTEEGATYTRDGRIYTYKNGKWEDVGPANYGPQLDSSPDAVAARLGVRTDQLPPYYFWNMAPSVGTGQNTSAAASNTGKGTAKSKQTQVQRLAAFASKYGNNNGDYPEPNVDGKGTTAYSPVTGKPIQYGNLDGIFPDNYDPNIAASLAQYYDDKYTTKVPGDGRKFNAYRDIATSVGGYAFDAYRLYEGLQGAKEELPVFSKPYDWTQYVGRLKDESTRGLSAIEIGNLQTQADRVYATDVANIYNASGGSAGTVLGNLGRAAYSRNLNQANIAAMDRQAYAQNLARYGSVLGTDVNLDRMIYSDKYQNAFMNKQSAAKLASDAITNMMERSTTDRFYGPGSEHDRLLQMEIEQQQEQKDILSSYKDYIRRYGFTNNYGPQIALPA